MDIWGSCTSALEILFHPGTKSLIYSVAASGMFRCFHQARQSPRIFHSFSDIIFSRLSHMIPVTVAQVTAQFLELSACPITSHIHGQTDHTSAIGIHTASTISEHLQQLPPILRNTIGHCHFPLDTSNLVEEFNSETLVLSSYGSVLMGDATQGWILYGTHSDTQAYGHGPVPGGGQPLTSLCAEVGGYVGGMLALDAILSTANNVSHAPYRKLGALIDNKALISRIQKWSHHGHAGTLAPDYDLLQAAQQVMKKHNILVVPDHITNHQDDSRDYNDLPWQAKLNCDCDQMAGASHKCLICCGTLHKRYDLPTGHIASLDIDGYIITSHVATAIKEASYLLDFIEYITQRSGWQDKETYHTIDCMAQSRAGKQLPSGQCLSSFKLEFALFATMSQRHQMEQGINHRCPRCQRFQGTLVHVFQCPRASEICKGALTRALASIRKKTYMPICH
jgi:hypothetical protein